MGDKDIPYRLLRKVMYTAARANFSDVSFAVTQKGASMSTRPAARRCSRQTRGGSWSRRTLGFEFPHAQRGVTNERHRHFISPAGLAVGVVATG